MRRRWVAFARAPAPSAMFFQKVKIQHVGPLRADRIPECVVLHAGAFHRGWDEGEFRSLLRDPSVLSSAATDARSGRLVGFALSRRALDEAELLTIAVARKARGSGAGTKLLNEHLAKLTAAGVKSLFLEVDEGNAAALALYARAGFAKVGERRGYYQSNAGPAATALIMRWDAK
jgi:ribosomal-protein-alanine N-acetyltransferase